MRWAARIAPAGVAPHFALLAQAPHLAVEGVDQKIAGNLLVVDADHAVDRRFLNLDHGTAGIGELVSSAFMTSDRAMMSSRRPR